MTRALRIVAARLGGVVSVELGSVKAEWPVSDSSLATVGRRGVPGAEA